MLIWYRTRYWEFGPTILCRYGYPYLMAVPRILWAASALLYDADTFFLTQIFAVVTDAFFSLEKIKDWGLRTYLCIGIFWATCSFCSVFWCILWSTGMTDLILSSKNRETIKSWFLYPFKLLPWLECLGKLYPGNILEYHKLIWGIKGQSFISLWSLS